VAIFGSGSMALCLHASSATEEGSVPTRRIP
jgi:hypothetical protein